MTEIPEAPNWLSELEAKREKRLKVRLGHEAGAGAPCLTCITACPGLDLHFWRKICKNCKCSKENHDVHDDDIYGWAQFQLLGNKPNKIKRKIVLPGRKEVELDWAPKGHDETVDKYLKTLPLENLVIKGSEAAKFRKQLLQKQIPIHDLDPTLCHDLSDLEMNKMNDYLKHMKDNSVGVGCIVQTQVHPIIAPISENVQLQSGNRATTLTKQFENLKLNRSCSTDDLTIQNQTKIPNSAGMPTQMIPRNLSETEQFPRKFPDFKNIQYPIYENKNNIPNYVANNTEIQNEIVKPYKYGNIKDLAFSTFLDSSNSANNNLDKNNMKSLKSFNPNLNQNPNEEILIPNLISIGAVKDINYDTFNNMHEEKESDGTLTNQIENHLPRCHRCLIEFQEDEFAIFVERSNSLFHSNCFKCAGCNQSLADMVYFYDNDSNNIYCGRDYAKIRGIPRCKACDELIFVKEYCLAENSTYHVKHFCCFECDGALAGQNYITEDSQPLCVPCFEKVKANKCSACLSVIKPDEKGASLNGVHFHADDKCFACKMCKKELLRQKLLLRQNNLFCSHDCYKIMQNNIK